MRNAIHRLFTISFLLLLGSCSVKWATNKVLTNRAAIEQVGAVYDALTPKDTTERLVFISGDSIVTEVHDTTYSRITDTLTHTNTIYVTKQIRVSKTDTIVRTLPPDNRKIARLSDSLALYRSLAANYAGNSTATAKQLKTAETRLIWMAGILLLAGVVIGVLVRFKLKP